jgi:hypothetical protein
MTDSAPTPPAPPPPPVAGDPGLGAQKVKGAGAGLMAAGILMLLGTLFNLWGATPQGQQVVMEQMAAIFSSFGPEFEQAFEEAMAQQQSGSQMITNIFSVLVSFVCSVITIAGAYHMRRLTAYPVALAGCIAAMIPCFNACCCFAMPLGIWAVVVLSNKDVKAAFAHVAQAQRQAVPHG